MHISTKSQDVLELVSSIFFCGIYIKKKKLRKSGYIVDKPKDYSKNNYGTIQTHYLGDVRIYYKYGKKLYFDETTSKFIAF
tara:strand:- start:1563 stop:1805 length:243 start_codon:yes stop_codon:yes gene_type:complete